MPKKILIPIDYDDAGSWRKVLPQAVEEARLHGAELSAVTVIPDILRLPGLPADYGSGAHDHVKSTVEGIVKDQGHSFPVSVRQGSVYREILKEAQAAGTDLIMMASPKGESPDYLLGPNAARVVRHANCSVQIVRD